MDGSCGGCLFSDDGRRGRESDDYRGNDASVELGDGGGRRGMKRAEARKVQCVRCSTCTQVVFLLELGWELYISSARHLPGTRDEVGCIRPPAWRGASHSGAGKVALQCPSLGSPLQRPMTSLAGGHLLRHVGQRPPQRGTFARVASALGRRKGPETTRRTRRCFKDQTDAKSEPSHLRTMGISE